VIADLWAELDGDGPAPVAASDAAAVRLVELEALPGLDLTPGLAEFLEGIGCWPAGVPAPRLGDAPAPDPGPPRQAR
jgi:hypothetical protein